MTDARNAVVGGRMVDDLSDIYAAFPTATPAREPAALAPATAKDVAQIAGTGTVGAPPSPHFKATARLICAYGYAVTLHVNLPPCFRPWVDPASIPHFPNLDLMTEETLDRL